MNKVNQTSSTAIVSPIFIGAPGKESLSEESLSSFIWKERINRQYIWITLVGSVIQLILLKLLFPFPDFISDSYNYIESAALHLNVNLWPIGYAKFLWLIHQIHYSDTFLVCVQYVILESALLHFFYTIIYLFRPSRFSRNALFIFLLFNPMFLYLTNCVLSDALFSAITIVWLTQLCWMLHRPRLSHIIVSAILIGAAFTIRYTAIYYPLVMVVALLLTRQKPSVKLIGALLPLTLMLPFILFTQQKTKEITGTAEFSVFGGWQIANNALYMYGHIDVDPKQLPPETVELDAMVKQYYKSAPPGWFNFDDYPGTFFIKHSDAPLKQYMYKHSSQEEQQNGLLSWGKVSPVYNAYGNYLINHYPISFIRYYMLLNTRMYFSPFLEKYGSYNVGTSDVWPTGQYWFHYPTPDVRVASKSLLPVIFYLYPSVFMLLNIYFAGAFLWLFVSGRLRRFSLNFVNVLWLTVVFLVINFGFSVFATPVVMRYQVISMSLLFVFSLLLFEFTDSKRLTK